VSLKPRVVHARDRLPSQVAQRFLDYVRTALEAEKLPLQEGESAHPA
jgi:hypothetical protein